MIYYCPIADGADELWTCAYYNECTGRCSKGFSGAMDECKEAYEIEIEEAVYSATTAELLKEFGID